MSLDVVNRCTTGDGRTEATGVARVVDETSRAKLEVRFAPAFLSFLPMVWGDYGIIGLASDDRWAVVGTPDRKYLWVLPRTPALSDADYAAALDTARASGFDLDTLVKTRQTER